MFPNRSNNFSRLNDLIEEKIRGGLFRGIGENNSVNEIVSDVLAVGEVCLTERLGHEPRLVAGDGSLPFADDDPGEVLVHFDAVQLVRTQGVNHLTVLHETIHALILTQSDILDLWHSCHAIGKKTVDVCAPLMVIPHRPCL